MLMFNIFILRLLFFNISIFLVLFILIMLIIYKYFVYIYIIFIFFISQYYYILAFHLSLIICMYFSCINIMQIFNLIFSAFFLSLFNIYHSQSIINFQLTQIIQNIMISYIYYIFILYTFCIHFDNNIVLNLIYY